LYNAKTGENVSRNWEKTEDGIVYEMGIRNAECTRRNIRHYWERVIIMMVPPMEIESMLTA
jgi:hypothetical protein